MIERHLEGHDGLSRDETVFAYGAIALLIAAIGVVIGAIFSAA